MIIRVSADLKKEEIWANGVELANIMGLNRVKGKRVISYPETEKRLVHVFDNPVLMTDNFRISKLNSSKRDTLFSLFFSRMRTVEYDGVSTLDKGEYRSVWCPSIDTVLFAKALRKVFRKRKNFSKAIEIGTGSGFLSKYCLVKNKTIKSILVNDLNPHAVQIAMENIKDKRANYYIGDGIEKVKQNKYDLILCNPPYIPRPESIDDNSYEGVSLLYDLVHNGQNYLNERGVIITNISSLCWHIIMKSKPKMKITVLERLKVPLKVNNVVNNKAWISYLLNKNYLKRKMHHGYEYWQELFIVMLEKD
jgi:tRNA1(Val) A37 N6-methylase TrmN6